MIKYICEACKEEMTKAEQENNVIEGKSYCDKHKAKVDLIVGNLQAEKKGKIKDVDIWYDAEKAAQITAQCPPVKAVESLKEVEEVVEEVVEAKVKKTK